MRKMSKWAGEKDGQPAYVAAGCGGAYGSGSGATGRRWMGKWAGEKEGLPVYVVAECLEVGGSGSGNVAIGRAIGKYVGEKDGLPVYERVCCQGAYSGSGGYAGALQSFGCCLGTDLGTVFVNCVYLSHVCTLGSQVFGTLYSGSSGTNSANQAFAATPTGDPSTNPLPDVQGVCSSDPSTGETVFRVLLVDTFPSHSAGWRLLAPSSFFVRPKSCVPFCMEFNFQLQYVGPFVTKDCTVNFRCTVNNTGAGSSPCP